MNPIFQLTRESRARLDLFTLWVPGQSTNFKYHNLYLMTHLCVITYMMTLSGRQKSYTMTPFGRHKNYNNGILSHVWKPLKSLPVVLGLSSYTSANVRGAPLIIPPSRVLCLILYRYFIFTFFILHSLFFSNR